MPQMQFFLTCNKKLLFKSCWKLKTRNRKEYTSPNKTWRRKSQNLNIEECNVALQAEHKVSWYVDSGCSKHMTGNRKHFIHLDEGKDGTVSFGNENSSKIIRKGTFNLYNKNIRAGNV